MRLHKVEITQEGRAVRVLIDGNDVAGALVGAHIRMEPREQWPEVSLDLLPGALAWASDTARVEIDQSTREVLVALGWIPPPS